MQKNQIFSVTNTHGFNLYLYADGYQIHNCSSDHFANFRPMYLLPAVHHNRIHLSLFKLNMSVVDTCKCLSLIFSSNNRIFGIWLSTWPSGK